jgi:crotonobetainyl-CoA:carnitine CoA-transferase CaiB-like acyl-CoA transferase
VTSGPLDGALVLELGEVYDGPYCGMLLHHLGADVVKIEPPEGDPVRARRGGGTDDGHAFGLLNGGKRGVCLDLETEGGTALFLRLVERADVVIETFAPGGLERLRIGWARLAEVNPRLVLASGRAYAAGGPREDWTAMDLAIQAMTGLVRAAGMPGRQPLACGPSVTDFLGGVHLATAVLAALLERERTGAGQHVGVAMQDAALPALTPDLAAHLDGDRGGPERAPLAVCPYDLYPAQDGWVAVGCMTTSQWIALAEAMNRDDLAEDPTLWSLDGRAARLEELDQLIGAWSRRRSRAATVGQLQAVGVPCAPVATVEEVLEDAHLRAVGMLERVDGSVAFGSPLRGSRWGRRPPRTAPVLGEHTDAVLAERLGLGHEELRELHRARVL